MTPKNNYPRNPSIRARMDAILSGFTRCHSVLQNLDTFAEDLKLPELVRKQITDALEAAKLASDAIAGEP